MTDCSGENSPSWDTCSQVEGVDISKLVGGRAATLATSETFRKTVEEMDRRMRPYQEMQDKLSPLLKSAATTQKAMESALGPFRDLQDRMKSLSLTAGEDSSLARVARQIGAQQSAIETMQLPDPKIPRLPPIALNPIIETNRRLERIEKSFEQMQGIATNAAEIATGLQGATAEFLQKFEKAATDNDRSAARAIWIGAIAVIIAVAMPTAQIIYSEYRREPSNGVEIQTALEGVQAELSAMRNAQAAASERLNETLATSDSETAAILLGIHKLISLTSE